MRWIPLMFVACCSVLSTAPARADVVPPEIAECSGKEPGDTCSKGKCQSATCSRLDYTRWDRDASSAPPLVDYDCLRCGAMGSSTGSDGGARAEDEKDGGCAVAPARIGSHAAALAFAATFGWLIARSRRRRE